MSATVQAVCPGCRNVLRIPIDWAERAMKCKKCGMVMQGRKRPGSSTSETPPNITVPTVAASAPPAGSGPTTAVPAQERPAPAPQPMPQAMPVPVPPANYPQQAYVPQPYGHPQQYVPQPYGQPQPYPYPPTAGYAQPYPYPPQPGYPMPPGYGAPPGYSPTPADVAFQADFEPSAPAGKAYRRRRGNRWVGPLVVLLLCGGLIGGAYYMMKKIDADQQRQSPSAANTNNEQNSANSDASSRLAVDLFPRRMLFVHISKYIYFNNLTPGSGGRGEDLPTKTAKKIAFEWHVPTDKDTNQLFVLSDTAEDKNFRPPIKSILAKAIDDFCTTSREQDRIVFYFGGHAVEIDDKAYLVPVEGEPDAPETLLPIEEVFNKFKDCKAQEKVILLDVCRYNTQYGATKPGSQPMSEKLAQLLHAAPPGVQVVTSCSAGENAAEIQDTGSEFLTAFRVQARRIKLDTQTSPAPSDPLPVQQWMDAIKAYLSGKRDNRIAQTVKVAGQSGSKNIPYNKDEDLAKRFDWGEAPKGVSISDINKSVQAVSLPGIRKDLEIPSTLGQVYPFDPEVMKEYAEDGVAEDQILKDPTLYPVRFATLDALRTIREQWTFGENGLKESFEGELDDKAKRDALEDQTGPALIELELKGKMEALEKVADKLPEEKSKRWQAMYQYAKAQTQMRWAFIEEYRGALGKIRTDNLPKPEKGKAAGYRLASTDKMTSKRDILEKADEARETLEQMAKDHKGTPWEVLAKMHKNLALGLRWEVIPEPVPDEEKMEMMEKKAE